MLKLLKALRQDEYGVILSTEIVIIGSVLVIGLITGLTCLQKSVNGELKDLAGAIDSLDQSYSYSAHRKAGVAGQCCAYTAGSAFNNCERQGNHATDIIGCDSACVGVQARSCGDCGNCNDCLGGSAVGSACGTCGGRAGGCSACGSGSSGGAPYGARLIDTGVPKMKVTEWPASECPPAEFPVHFDSSIQPEVETIVVPAQEGSNHGSETIIEHSAPEKKHHHHDPNAHQEKRTEPTPATEPLPEPMPQA